MPVDPESATAALERLDSDRYYSGVIPPWTVDLPMVHAAGISYLVCSPTQRSSRVLQRNKKGQYLNPPKNLKLLLCHQKKSKQTVDKLNVNL